MPSTEHTPGHTPCPECGFYLNIGDWPWCPHEEIHPSHHTVHSSERAVVFENPATGEVRYPGRNDAPIPERYKKEGFVRKEFPTLASLERFERSHGVRNDKAHYNEGNSADQEAPPRKQLTDQEKREIWQESVQATR